MTEKKHNKSVLSDMELAIFCQQMAMVITAGLPAYQGISILMEDSDNATSKALFKELFEPMQLGSTLHAALRDTNKFPEYMVNMIELGEETGKLEEVLKSLAFYYEREAGIQSAVRHAITYPSIMIAMMFVIIIVMITQVLPIFSQIYAQLGSELTGNARFLMEISNILNSNLLGFVILVIVLLVLAIVFYYSPWGKKYRKGTKLAKKISAGRFASCMYLALASGLDTDRGLELASLLVDNDYMQEKISTCREHISNGEGFTKALTMSGIFSKMYSSWLSIGFTTGAMDEVMERISTAYQEETDEDISRFISLLEPILVAILSFLIGLILLSFILPLLGIISSIG